MVSQFAAIEKAACAADPAKKKAEKKAKTLTMITPPPAEEEVVCRVCQLSLEDEPEKRLFYPCRCSGSIKYVHEDCLAQWLRVKKSKKDACEVCGALFEWRTLYRKGAPRRLPALVFARLALARLLRPLVALWRVLDLRFFAFALTSCSLLFTLALTACLVRGILNMGGEGEGAASYVIPEQAATYLRRRQAHTLGLQSHVAGVARELVVQVMDLGMRVIGLDNSSATGSNLTASPSSAAAPFLSFTLYYACVDFAADICYGLFITSFAYIVLVSIEEWLISWQGRDWRHAPPPGVGIGAAGGGGGGGANVIVVQGGGRGGEGGGEAAGAAVPPPADGQGGPGQGVHRAPPWAVAARDSVIEWFRDIHDGIDVALGFRPVPEGGGFGGQPWALFKTCAWTIVINVAVIILLCGPPLMLGTALEMYGRAHDATPAASAMWEGDNNVTRATADIGQALAGSSSSSSSSSGVGVGLSGANHTIEMLAAAASAAASAAVSAAGITAGNAVGSAVGLTMGNDASSSSREESSATNRINGTNGTNATNGISGTSGSSSSLNSQGSLAAATGQVDKAKLADRTAAGEATLASEVLDISTNTASLADTVEVARVTKVAAVAVVADVAEVPVASEMAEMAVEGVLTLKGGNLISAPGGGNGTHSSSGRLSLVQFPKQFRRVIVGCCTSMNMAKRKEHD